MNPPENTIVVDPQVDRIIELSTRVEGFVELETLRKIEVTLRESGDFADIELSQWIKENYLYQPFGELEDGRPVKSREGFERLNQAYKRVRSLTDRAQDKWPFFDRYWKKLPASTVKQATQEIISSQEVPTSALREMNALPAGRTTPAAAVYKPSLEFGITTEVAATMQSQKTPQESQIQSSPTVAEHMMTDVDGGHEVDQTTLVLTSPVTAAHALPVPSNLDTLPQSSPRMIQKRVCNSDGNFTVRNAEITKNQTNGRGGKRGRGGRAGRGGRGGGVRKSESTVTFTDTHMEHTTPSENGEKAVTEETMQSALNGQDEGKSINTQRTTRRAERVSSWEPPNSGGPPSTGNPPEKDNRPMPELVAEALHGEPDKEEGESAFLNKVPAGVGETMIRTGKRKITILRTGKKSSPAVPASESPTPETRIEPRQTRSKQRSNAALPEPLQTRAKQGNNIDPRPTRTKQNGDAEPMQTRAKQNGQTKSMQTRAKKNGNAEPTQTPAKQNGNAEPTQNRAKQNGNAESNQTRPKRAKKRKIESEADDCGMIDGDAKRQHTPSLEVEFFARVQGKSGPIEVAVPTRLLGDGNNLTGSVQRYVAWKEGEGKDVTLAFDQFHNIFTSGASSR